MKVVIAGAGTAGYQIAKELISEGKDVVVIEKDEEIAKYVSDNLDCMVITGKVNDIDILEQAGLDNADFFVCLTDSDELNIISCSMAHHEYRKTYNIARVRDKRYYDTKLIKNPDLGIDYVVNPEIESANTIAKLVHHGVTSDMVFFEHSNLQMRKVLVSSNSVLAGRAISELRKIIPVDFLIAGTIRDDEFIIASGDTVIRENDQLYILSSTEKLDKIFGIIGKEKKRINNIVIAGGGTIGDYILEMLLGKSTIKTRFSHFFENPFYHRQKKYIRLIEKDAERAKMLASKYHEILVINEDITDEDIFEEEQLLNCDLIITTTNNSELNVLMAIYSKLYGIKKAIALVKQKNYLNIASRLGIDALISPNDSIVNSILKLIRRGKVKSLHTLASTDAEVIEMTIEKNSPVIGKTIKDIQLPGNCLILVVNRVSKSYIPDGEFIIEEKDDIIVVTKKSNLEEIERVFIA